jgi:hypothetical protein
MDRLTKQIEVAGIAVERGDQSAVVFDPFQNRIRLVLPDQLMR